MMMRGIKRNLKATRDQTLLFPPLREELRIATFLMAVCQLGTLPRKIKSLRQMSKSVSFPRWEDLHVEGPIVLRMTCLRGVKVLC